MVESQESLYGNMSETSSQDFNLSGIDTEDLLLTNGGLLNEHQFAFEGDVLCTDVTGQYTATPMDSFTFIDSSTTTMEHWNKLPSLEQVDTEWNFDVGPSSESASKTSYMYSSKLNKVFVKINTSLHLYPSYTQIDSSKELHIRAMIVYTSQNDLAEPVKKCPNHKDQSRDNKDHILKCDLLETSYVGHELGKLFCDKLALVIPMHAIAPNEPFKLEFTCQNSCSGGINRKMTSLVFTLEDASYNILGRKIMNFKVCSCPKRDKDKDEIAGIAKALPKKRKADSSAAPSTSKKIALPLVKQESSGTLSMDSDQMIVPFMPSDLTNETLIEPNLVKHEQQSCVLTITLPDEEIKKKVLEQAYNIVAGKMTRQTDDAYYQEFLTNIQKQIDEP